MAATSEKKRSGGSSRSSGKKRSGGSSRSGKKTATYVYGIVPGDVEVSSEMKGVGDPAGKVTIVRSGDLAALVSPVDPDNALGSPEDLTAHKEVLDATATEVPVLPLRFGGVVTDEEAVAEELLEPNHDEFAEALDELDGRVQYVVKGRYQEQAILDEVLSENKEAERLRKQISGKNPDATRNLRIELGELINNAVEAKRERDTRVVGDAMADHCVASRVREPTHERDAAHIAFLVETGQEKDMEKAIEGLARKWEGRVEFRLLGPMAAYDFVGTTQPGD